MDFLAENSNLLRQERIASSVSTHLIILVLFLILNFGFGFLSINIKNKNKNTKVLSFFTTFKVGVGLATSFFLLLPLSSDKIKKYFEAASSNHIIQDLSWSLITCLATYTFSLLLLKMMFENESNGHSHAHSTNELDSIKDEEEKEDILKNLISTRGRFQTFLGVSNLKKQLKEGTDADLEISKKSSVLRASIILSKTMMSNKWLKEAGSMISEKIVGDDEYLVNPKNVRFSKVTSKNEGIKNESIPDSHNHDSHDHEHEHERDETHESHEHSHKSVNNCKAYILLLVIGIQALSVGISIGTNEYLLETVSLSICAFLYKSIETFSLIYSLKNVFQNSYSLLRLLLLQSLFIPIGIGLGILIDFNGLAQGIVYATSAGVLLYQSTTEGVIEEFAFTKNRFTKYFIFLTGGLLVATIVCLINI